MLNGQGKIVLFLPPYEGKVFGPPLGLLSLSASLTAAGFDSVIIDGAIEPSYLEAIAAALPGAMAFGVSLLTGPMIDNAIAASKLVRRLSPSMPIIFGGWHPSLLSAQTLQEDFVDVVVRHQGERTLVELLERIRTGSSFDMVAGCWFKRGGRILSNPDRPSIPLHALPSPAYERIDFAVYEKATGGRKLPYATSIGCPYACNYCTDSVFYNRRFNPQDVNNVVTEICHLVKKHELTEVALVDSNFLVDTRRAVAIAQGICDSQLKFRWTFQASTDLLCRMTDEEIIVLGRSGVNHIGFGTESASPEILKRMNKPHQNVNDMFEAARKCALAGIRVTFNLIFGYPGEEDRHRRETIRIMGQISERYPNVNFSPNLFTPYPGIPIWPQLQTMGLREPDTLRGWAGMGLGGTKLPWLTTRSRRDLQRGMSFFLLDNQLGKQMRKTRFAVSRSALRMLRKPLHWRLRYSYFNLPLELWLSMAKEWLTMRRSLLTGDPLGRSLGQAR